MIYHKQLIGHNPGAGKYGDCHRAAIACLLDMQPYQVPNFGEHYNDPDAFHEAVELWLSRRGYQQVHNVFDVLLEQVLLHLESINPGVYYLLGGTSNRGFGHTVVGCGGEIVWDPAVGDPDGKHSIAGPMSDGLYWVTYLVSTQFKRK